MSSGKKPFFLIFLGFYVISLAVEIGGSVFTQMSVVNWYPTLVKSPLTPPGAAFGIAWTILYFLMAFSAARIYRRTGTLRCHALRWWLVQLLLGLLWSIMFFGHRSIESGMQIILANWFAVAITIYLFRRIDRLAAWLLVPLLGWLSFATYLNFYIFTHN